MNNRALKTLFQFFFVVGLCQAVSAEDAVGKVVALRGKATIQRDRTSLDASLKMGIQLRDTFQTGPNARAKLMFIDGSVLTLGDNSKLVVKEFIYAKGEKGKSIFNLIDGKMRSVVGRTKFEVQTPTAVASARGTVIFFDVGAINNQLYSKIICLEGNVRVRNINPAVTGEVTLTPGTMILIKEGEPLPKPVNLPNASGQNNFLSLGEITNPKIPLVPPLPLQEPVTHQGRPQK
jgi:hypothetical protein